MNWKIVAFSGLVAAAVLLPLRKPKAAEGATQATASNRSERLDTLYWKSNRARFSYSAFDLRDSAAAIAAASVRSAMPTVHWQGFPGRAANATDDSVVAEFWRELGPTKPNVVVSVLMFNQKAYQHPYYQGVYIKTTGDRTDCVGVQPEYDAGKSRAVPMINAYSVHSALGECALVAAFGAPHGGAAKWMGRTRYAADGSYSWFYIEKHLRPEEHLPWLRWMSSNRDGAPRNTVLFNAVGLADLAYGVEPPYEFGAAGVRCLAGDDSKCSAALLESGNKVPASYRFPEDLALSYYWQTPDSVTLSTVRPADATVMSDMIREFGREKFEKFWTSDKEMPEAFQDAFGETLDHWTARWSHGLWANSFDAMHRNGNVMLGVTLDPTWFPVAIGWSLIAVAIAVMVARRRTA